MRKVYLRSEKEFVECAVFEDDVFTRFFHIERNFLTGAIFVGKVKFVKKEVGIFVDIGLERDGILAYREGLKSGDTVPVRVCTEPEEGRGCTLSEKLTLSGKYVVLLGNGEKKFSHELSEETKKKLCALPPIGTVGFLYRSLCKEGEENLIQAEREKLYNRFTQISVTAKNTVQPTLLYRISAEEIAENMAEEVCRGFEPIQKEIDVLSERKITVDGVELVFDKTEAMTVVDVNFHQFAGRGKEAIMDADRIAVREFARQVRLRNLSGIIALDYINVGSDEKKAELFSLLQKEIKSDYVSCSAEHAEKAGVFILTRQGRYSPF